MTLVIAAEAPPLTALEDGSIRVRGTRMPLEVLVRAHAVSGLSAEQIVARFPRLDLADVYSVLGYYHRHRGEVEAYLARQDDAADELRRQFEALRGPQPTRSELLKRRTFRAGERVPAGGVWRCREDSAEAVLPHGGRFPGRGGAPDATWEYVAESPEQSRP